MRHVFAALAILAVGAPPAIANHHDMRITEVFAGAPGRPNVQFVELQMYSPGQQFVAGSALHFLTPSGAEDGTFTFGADAGNGSDNATILAATDAAATYFGVEPDLTIEPKMARGGGKVEFLGTPGSFGQIDAFSWGSYNASHVGSGTRFGQGTGGLPSGLSAARDVSGGSVPGQLDPNDDTGSSATDFDPRVPSPVNNAGQTSTRATSVSIMENGTLQIEAGGLVENAITVSGPTTTGWRIVDAAAPVQLAASAVDACFSVNVMEVRCEVADPGFVVVYGGDGDDRVTIAGAIESQLQGGSGDDRLTGGSVDDVLSGGEDGNDTLMGGRGDDALDGGINNDFLDGGHGADDLDGDTGTDRASYGARTAGVTVTMDGTPNDGNGIDESGGRRDNVQASVERLTGSQGADTLTGNTSGNQITGGPGPDRIFGRGGPDTIITKGDGAADEVDCGSGDDFLSYDDGIDFFWATGPGACETANP